MKNKGSNPYLVQLMYRNYAIYHPVNKINKVGSLKKLTLFKLKK